MIYSICADIPCHQCHTSSVFFYVICPLKWPSLYGNGWKSSLNGFLAIHQFSFHISWPLSMRLLFSSGYLVAGMAKSSYCSCYNHFDLDLKIESDQCEAKCSGNSSQTCGGQYWNLSIWTYMPSGMNSLNHLCLYINAYFAFFALSHLTDIRIKKRSLCVWPLNFYAGWI